jgi:integrase
MIYTFNGCYRSEIKVTPKNWHTKKASTATPWRIHYRFYDPAFKNDPKYKKGKQVPIKGMNHVTTLGDRQAITRCLIADEMRDIDKLGYNPITGVYMAPQAGDSSQDITADTPLLPALKAVLKSCDVDHDTRIDMTSALKYFEESAVALKKDFTPLREIKSKDIRLILDNCRNLVVTQIVNKRIEVKGKAIIERKPDGTPVKTVVQRKKVWNERQFNHYRKYLSILFAEIERQEIIEYNPVEKIPKKEIAVDPDAKRPVLSLDQRRQVDAYLKEKFPAFHRFIHIFFHSGARRKELMRLQGKNVDIEGQRFKVLVNKRKKKTWVWKTIKDVALPYWQDAMKDCGPMDFVFSAGLVPGAVPIRPEQVTRRWKEHVKKDLGIDPDLYSLKHLHTTEVRTELEKAGVPDSAKELAEHNSHTSGAMVIKIYDVEHDKREHKKVKGVQNSFAG